MASALPWLDPNGNVLCRYCRYCAPTADGVGDCTEARVGFTGVVLDMAECGLGEADPQKIEHLQKPWVDK